MCLGNLLSIQVFELKQIFAFQSSKNHHSDFDFLKNLFQNTRENNLSNVTKWVNCWKELYRLANAKNVHPLFLYDILCASFSAAMSGYNIFKIEEFKLETENIARAADKFEEILGSNIVTNGKPDKWKLKFQNFDKYYQLYSTGIIKY